MKYNYKVACFANHCPTCKYEAVKEEDEPCNECLDYPVNLNTDKPVKWEEKKE